MCPRTPDMYGMDFAYGVCGFYHGSGHTSHIVGHVMHVSERSYFALKKMAHLCETATAWT